MNNTSIEWTDATVNPIRFGRGHYCQKISPGCANCYASRLQPRFGNPEFGGAGSAPPEPEAVYLDIARLEKAMRGKKGKRIFWCDMTDIFGDWVREQWLDQCFAAMALTPHHTHQILTKRPERMREYIGDDPIRRAWMIGKAADLFGGLPTASRYFGPTAEMRWPLPNVWLGVSAEDQKRADDRIPVLMQTPAAVRFVSYEPALGPLQLRATWTRGARGGAGAAIPGIDWLIAGGESGPGARTCNVAWLRAILAECRTAAVACFVKQLGARPIDESTRDFQARPAPGVHISVKALTSTTEYDLRDRKGGDMTEWPADLRVRQFPAAARLTA